jgi:protease-4
MNLNADSSTDSSSSPPPPPLPRRRAKRRIPVILWILLGASVLGNMFWFASRRTFTWFEGGIREYPPVEATLAWGDASDPVQVAVLSLEGVILDEANPTLFGEEPSPVARLISEIQAVTVDPSYNAILLNVDSPGGGVTASDEIYRALMRFKESNPDRKLVVHVQDMAASGGYYASLAADQIVAQPTSIVGSIGVLISAVNFHKLGEKLGIQDVTLASSDNKALLNALDPVNPEHMAILQEVVDDMYDRFRTLVIEHRPFDEEFADTHHLMDGRIFTVTDALGLGLVDRVGYQDLSRQTVMELLGVSSAAFYDISFSSPSFSWFSAKSPKISLPTLPRSRLMYLWTP